MHDKKHGITGALSLQESTPIEILQSRIIESYLINCDFYESIESSRDRERILGKLNYIADKIFGGKIFTFGSYRLGVHQKGADIDTLLIAPSLYTHADFFSKFYEVLELFVNEKNINENINIETVIFSNCSVSSQNNNISSIHPLILDTKPTYDNVFIENNVCSNHTENCDDLQVNISSCKLNPEGSDFDPTKVNSNPFQVQKMFYHPQKNRLNVCMGSNTNVSFNNENTMSDSKSEFDFNQSFLEQKINNNHCDESLEKDKTQLSVQNVNTNFLRHSIMPHEFPQNKNNLSSNAILDFQENIGYTQDGLKSTEHQDLKNDDQTSKKRRKLLTTDLNINLPKNLIDSTEQDPQHLYPDFHSTKSLYKDIHHDTEFAKPGKESNSKYLNTNSDDIQITQNLNDREKSNLNQKLLYQKVFDTYKVSTKEFQSNKTNTEEHKTDPNQTLAHTTGISDSNSTNSEIEAHKSNPTSNSDLCKTITGIEIKDLRKIEEAFVPLIKFEINGIPIDLLFCRVHLTNLRTLSLSDDTLLKNMDEKSILSINGSRVADLLIDLVPSTKTFHTVLRAIKYWAQRRGIYGHAYGYPGGVAYAILTARICQYYPKKSPYFVLKKFFEIYSTWKWPAPVLLKNIVDKRYNLKVWDPKNTPSDRLHKMPIITPAYPSICSTHNVSQTTLGVITVEFKRGLDIMAQFDSYENLFEPAIAHNEDLCNKIFESSSENLLKQTFSKSNFSNSTIQSNDNLNEKNLHINSCKKVSTGCSPVKNGENQAVLGCIDIEKARGGNTECSTDHQKPFDIGCIQNEQDCKSLNFENEFRNSNSSFSCSNIPTQDESPNLYIEKRPATDISPPNQCIDLEKIQTTKSCRKIEIPRVDLKHDDLEKFNFEEKISNMFNFSENLKLTLKKLFQPTDFFKRYPYYLEIKITKNEIWKGFIESKLRLLCLKLESNENYSISISLSAMTFPQSFLQADFYFFFVAIDYKEKLKLNVNKPINDFIKMSKEWDKRDSMWVIEINVRKKKDIGKFLMDYYASMKK